MSETIAAGGGITPEQVFTEYTRGMEIKRGLGKHGLYEQSRINERFFAGDQWQGANCGDSRPLVRYNIIRRIGEYKMAVIGTPPVDVQFSAEGVPNTLELQKSVEAYRTALRSGQRPEPLTGDEEAQAVARAMTEYFSTTAGRLGLDMLKHRALRNAYTTGTGVLYTYWDERVRTGLYADVSRTAPICGDIACEVLDIQQVYMGDPLLEDVQQQPYIIIAQSKPVAELQRLARGYGCRRWRDIRPDEGGEDTAAHATVLTRFWKVWDENGGCRVLAVQVCRGVVLRREWSLGLGLYPLAMFRWQERRGCAYGESEIPQLIPNQIAINRTASAGVWAVLAQGMPIMTVNGDVVSQPITNDPGQIVTLYGSEEELRNAIRYVDPPAFSPQFENNVTRLMQDTMEQAGVNTTLLGDVKPDNAQAILAVREASLTPLKMQQTRFYGFLEEVARIWLEFWLAMYGNRALKLQLPDGVWYMPFEASRYRELLLTVRVNVGEGSQYGELRTVETLDNLYQNGVITAKQYLSRLPQGYVPRLGTLLQELE